jgi:glycerophosphoryl diester phosphodiesterase
VVKASTVEVWGHRGSRTPGPENTPYAVRAALAAGAHGCEVDVRRTADGVLVCCHDPVAAGLTLVDATAAQLAAVGVPELAEVLAAAPGRLVLEVKNVPGEPDFTPEAATAQLLVAALPELRDRAGGAKDLLISSFDPAALDIAKAAGWATGLLTLPGVRVQDGLAYAIDAGYTELHAHLSMITEPAAAVHDAGLRLVGWTVVTPRQAKQALQLGVDAVICDDPAEVIAALSA